MKTKEKGMFGSLLDLVDSVVTTAVAPVSIAVDTARIVTAPVAVVADVAATAVKDVADTVAEELKGAATPLK